MPRFITFGSAQINFLHKHFQMETRPDPPHNCFDCIFTQFIASKMLNNHQKSEQKCPEFLDNFGMFLAFVQKFWNFQKFWTQCRVCSQPMRPVPHWSMIWDQSQITVYEELWRLYLIIAYKSKYNHIMAQFGTCPLDI